MGEYIRKADTEHTAPNGILRPDQVGDPLTLEQLRQMDGLPVLVEWQDGRIQPHWYIVGDSAWNMMEFDTFKDYGKWLAYVYPPAQNDRTECKGHKTMTKADWIRSLDDERLAKFICESIAKGIKDFCADAGYPVRILNSDMKSNTRIVQRWLEEDAKA